MIPISLLFCLVAAVPSATPTIWPARPNAIEFPAEDARFVRLVIHRSSGAEPCIDELEVYGPEGDQNLALASVGAKSSASSCLSGYAIHRVEHLNDGLYGNSHSWIAAGTADQWAEIELPATVKLSKVVFSRDREGQYADRLPVDVEVQLSLDGSSWRQVAKLAGASPKNTPAAVADDWSPEEAAQLADTLAEGDLHQYAFLAEQFACRRIDDADPVARVLRQMEAMLDRFAAKGIDVSQQRGEFAELRRRHEALAVQTPLDGAAEQSLFLAARTAKRRLFFRDPDLAALERILFVKRQPFEPSHNYSDIFDSQGAPGGAICVLAILRQDGMLLADRARAVQLFDCAGGIARDPMADFAAKTIYFGYRPSKTDYYHLYRMNADGSSVKRLTSGPFHDYYPCPLADGGIAFITTRCKARFLCWRPQAFTLFRMDAAGGDIRPLSHANLSEWTPAPMRDGRIVWMRSEYLDKGADFGHTLWAIRPDGAHPELLFGNDTRNCYANGREVPGTTEICCTLVSHGGDLNGPIALLDPSKGRFNPAAITNITPDCQPHYHMSWAARRCFRDPVPIARDYVLCSHTPDDRFGLYVIDRFGNRELLYLDPEIGSMCPTPLRAAAVPPVVSTAAKTAASDTDGEEDLGQFLVADVYRGLEPAVPRGAVKYLRVCSEVRSDLSRLANGEYRADHEPFQDWYAAPTHVVQGPYGWPSYVAKATYGLARVEQDGSANFYAPAGKVLYFEALDEHFNELQRMRSVVQLQPGEGRSCIGCHEDRMSAPPVRQAIALRREPQRLQEPPWGAGPLAYETVVQPVWDARCVGCHGDADQRQIRMTGTLDADRVPASYRTLITQGWVHYFDYTWGREHAKAAPRSFGTLQSKLWKLLDGGHYDVKLSEEETRRVKCWIDLNCPLWPDYQFRLDRRETAVVTAQESPRP